MKIIFVNLILVSATMYFSGCTGKDSGAQAKEDDKEIVSESPKVIDAKSKPVEEITIRAIGNTLNEMSYDLKEINVREGSRVKITLVNEAQDSAMIHNIVFVYHGTRNATAIAGLKAGLDMEYVADIPTIIAASGLAKPGQTVVLEFEAPEAGSYYFICTYPGHWEKMTGVFTVTAAA